MHVVVAWQGRILKMSEGPQATVTSAESAHFQMDLATLYAKTVAAGNFPHRWVRSLSPHAICVRRARLMQALELSNARIANWASIRNPLEHNIVTIAQPAHFQMLGEPLSAKSVVKGHLQVQPLPSLVLLVQRAQPGRILLQLEHHSARHARRENIQVPLERYNVATA